MIRVDVFYHDDRQVNTWVSGRHGAMGIAMDVLEDQDRGGEKVVQIIIDPDPGPMPKLQP